MFTVNDYELHPHRQNKSLRANRNGHSPCHQNEASRPQTDCNRNKHRLQDKTQLLSVDDNKLCHPDQVL